MDLEIYILLFIIIIGLVAFLILLMKYQVLKEDVEIKEIIFQRNYEEQKSKLRLEYENLLSQKVSFGVQKSKEVIRGKVTEELLPLFPGFPYQLSDCKFFGSPIDYIVFQNMSNYRDGINKDEVNIIIADVKNNTSGNTPVQNQIKKAILENRISFETWQIDEQNNITIKKAK